MADSMITINDAHRAWEAAFKQWHNIAAADAALSPITLSSWKTEQFLMLAKLVCQTIEQAEYEDLEEESEDEIGKDELEENAGQELGEESKSHSADELEHEVRGGDCAQGENDKATEGKQEDNSRRKETPVYEGPTVLGIRFSHLMWQQANKEPRLLVKLLWGVATEWSIPNVLESCDGDICEFAEVLNQWYRLYPDLSLAKQVAYALVQDEQWDAQQIGELCDCARSFKFVWKDFTLPELGQLFQAAIKNGRAQFKKLSSYDAASDLEDGDGEANSEEDEADNDGEDFEEVYDIAKVLTSLFKMLELTPNQQRDLFREVARKLFFHLKLHTLDVELGLDLTAEEWEDLIRGPIPKADARIIDEALRQEAEWCLDEYPSYSRQGYNNNSSLPPGQSGCPNNHCSNKAKRGCLRLHCGNCCKKAPAGSCAVHMGNAPRPTNGSSSAESVGGETQPTPLSAAAPAYVSPYREPSYTAEETQFVKSEAQLEEVLKAGGGVKKIIFRDFYVKNEQFVRVGTVFGSTLECMEMSEGEGYQLSGETIQAFAAACPGLKKFSMESAHNVKDDTFAALLKCCPELEYLDITGNDKVSGRLTDKSLKLLQKDAVLAPKLRILYLSDQRLSPKQAEKVVKERPHLHIQAGESDGNGYASMMVMQMQGRSYGDGIWEVGAGARPPSFGIDYSEYDFF